MSAGWRRPLPEPRIVFAALILLGSAPAAPAAAQLRPSTLRMSCREAIGLVRSRGAILLGTGGHTFDRYVSDRRFCEPTEVARPAFAPTRDTPACPVGNTCVEPSRDDFFWSD